MVLFSSLLYWALITLTGGHYGTSGSNLKRSSIMPWSQYEAVNSEINSLTLSQKVPSLRPHFSSLSLKGVSEKMTITDTITDNSIPIVLSLPPNLYFRQYITSNSSRISVPFNDSSNRRSWAVDHYQQKNYKKPYIGTVFKRRLIPVTENSGYYQMLEPQTTSLRTYSRIWEPSDLQIPTEIRLDAMDAFKQPISVSGSSTIRSIPSSHFSRHHSLSQPLSALSPDNNNIANAAMAHSNVRFAPFMQPFIGTNPGMFGESIAALLSSRGAMESLAKFARNLLTLPIPDQPNILSSLASAIAAGSKASQKSSNVVAEGSIEPQSNVLNAQQIFTEITKKNFPNKDTTNSIFEDETKNFLKTLPEEQRSLLQAAIQTGELDSRSLHAAIGNSNDKVAAMKQNEKKLLEWIQQNRKKAVEKLTVRTDKLPYYGKYCGSFIGQTSKSDRFNAAGALWAVDNRRFIVSKFQFNPGTLLTENVTFWAGPNVQTDNSTADMTPSANGFYLRPQPISWTIFHKPDVNVVEALIRTKHVVRKRQSNLLTKLYEPNTFHMFRERVNVGGSNSGSSAEINVNEKMVNISSNESDLSVSKMSNETNTKGTVTLTVSDNIEALGWYTNFQPLLFTLPANKWVRTINWFSLRDHKRQDTVAYVLIPNESAFKIPAVVQLRGLIPNNNQYNVKSKNIKVLDTKTIEVDEFYYTGNNLTAWFVVGKDILPNSNGHIVPIYNRADESFDCDSLRDYANETVILRLPGLLDIKDVFWFSVFSMRRGLSLSHIYFPYNDMHLPPDLTDISTPNCEWKNND